VANGLTHGLMDQFTLHSHRKLCA